MAVMARERAHAWLMLWRRDGLAADLEALERCAPADRRDIGDVYRAMMKCELGQLDEALAVSVRLQAGDAGDEYGEVLRAVRFACAHRLGRPEQAGALSRADLRLVARVRPDCYARL
jgi:hypothetical protein